MLLHTLCVAIQSSQSVEAPCWIITLDQQLSDISHAQGILNQDGELGCSNTDIENTVAISMPLTAEE